MPLADLGDDIILAIASFLSPDDIFYLSLTTKVFNSVLNSNSAYHLLYVKMFGSKPTPLSLDKYNWKELFTLRSSSKAKFYTWGSSELGRLGYLLSGIPADHISTSGFSKNVHTPTNLVNFNGTIITDINAGGFCFQILTNDGNLYYTGRSWKKSENSSSTPGPFEKSDYRPTGSHLMNSSSIPFIERMASRRLIHRNYGVTPMPGAYRRHDRDVPTSTTLPDPDRTTNPNLTRSSEELESHPESSAHTKNFIKESNFITRLELPNIDKEETQIKSISSGREHIIALDNHRNIYSWDTGNTSETGVHIVFPKLGTNLPVTKISAGWNLSVCHIDKIGLVVWYSREPVTEEDFTNKTMKSVARYIIIPGTANAQIIDFIAGCDYVLFIKNDGKLYKFTINAQDYASRAIDENIVDDPFPISTFNDWLSEHNEKAGTESTFTKLGGCYNKFVVFTDDSSVLLGKKDHDAPQIIPELQNKNVTQVVMGDYHYLALTKEGDLLSWGTESAKCGCLGLGLKETFIANHERIVKDLGGNKGMEVLVPSKVKQSSSEGKWLAIGAAGWHSCGIYVPSDTE